MLEINVREETYSSIAVSVNNTSPFPFILTT